MSEVNFTVREKMTQYGFTISSFLIAYQSATLVFAAIILAFGVSITGWLAVPSLLVAFLFMYELARGYNWGWEQVLIVLLILVIVIGSSLLFSIHVYDISWDGQGYQKEAVYRIANGWNPFHTKLAPEVNGHLLLNHFSKGAWINGAVIYCITQNIDSAKSSGFLLVSATFFLSLSSLLRIDKIPLVTSFLLSLLLALNPVSALQSLTFLVDGQMGSMLTCLAATSFLIFLKGEVSSHFLLAFVLIIITNLKFPGVVYGSLLVAALLAFLWIYKKKALIRTFCVSSASLAFAAAFVGYNPYLKNTIEGGHPFYPLYGKQNWDIMHNMMPGDFVNKNRFEKLFLSVFSRSENVGPEGTSVLKYPFTWDDAELKAFDNCDSRVGALGPLYGGATLVAFIMMSLQFLHLFRQRRELALISVILPAWLLFTVLVNPEAWWIRFAPQMWILPLLITVTLLLNPWRVVRGSSYGIILLLLINVTVITWHNYDSVLKDNAKLKRQLIQLAACQEPVEVFFGPFRTNRIWMDEWGVPFKEVKTFEELTCRDKMFLTRSYTSICMPPAYRTK